MNIVIILYSDIITLLWYRHCIFLEGFKNSFISHKRVILIVIYVYLLSILAAEYVQRVEWVEE